MIRAALLIGVSRTGGHTRLQAVESGLDAMEAWALAQGVPQANLARISDVGDKKVHMRDLQNWIEQKNDCTEPPDQLIVYFSGHGFGDFGSDYWLLSAAPDNPWEAVSLAQSIALARYCAFKHVIFFSDTCRSWAVDEKFMIRGSCLFPNRGSFDRPNSVDVFYASGPGEAAIEYGVGADSTSIYTAQLVQSLSGFDLTNPELPNDGHRSTPLVRMWSLGKSLSEGVPHVLLRTLGVTEMMSPDSRIESRPDAWIATVPEAPTLVLGSSPTGTFGEMAPDMEADLSRAHHAAKATRNQRGTKNKAKMLHRLVLIHGRSQQMKDPVALKQAWINAMLQGMWNSRLSLAVEEASIVFPYYGDALIGLIGGDGENAPPIQLKGLGNYSPAEEEFVEAILDEIATKLGLSDTNRENGSDASVTTKGFLNRPKVLATLRAIDARGGGGLAIKHFFHDVYSYINNPTIQSAIHDGLRPVFDSRPTVVVAHSLGTVIAYNFLRIEGKDRGWNIPTFITLGSPLSIDRISRSLAPIEFPFCVKTWRNARDPHDTVALNPLSPPNFPLLPIDAKDTVANTSANHHGIESYLMDTTVARWIYDALVL